jgi:membrane protease YdiL (CAAX protease family)
LLEKPNKKRLFLFLALAFGLAWLVALVIYLQGGLAQSPLLIPELNLTLAAALLAGGVMMAPALANLLTRLLTHEGKADLWLKPARFANPWRNWLLAWALPAVLTVLGAALFFLLFPSNFDRELESLRAVLSAAALDQNVSAWTYLLLNTLQALLLAPILNALFCFGEEFGWRAYLLPKLLPLGERKAALITGVIWGLWHAPVIAMGHNYGLDYPGRPWLGMLAMVLFCAAVGTLLGWLTLKEGSVWPAVIAHGALNGIAGLGLVAVKGAPSVLLGPAPTGILGGLFFTLFALGLLLKPGALEPGKEKWHPEPIILPQEPAPKPPEKD